MNQPDPLQESLRREALAGPPDFSPLLHERIVQSLTHDTTARRFSWRLLTTIAAAIALGVTTVIWSRPAATSKRPQTAFAPDISFRHFAVPTAQQFRDVQYAYLDRDAVHLIGFFSRQMDVLPAKQ